MHFLPTLQTLSPSRLQITLVGAFKLLGFHLKEVTIVDSVPQLGIFFVLIFDVSSGILLLEEILEFESLLGIAPPLIKFN